MDATGAVRTPAPQRPSSSSAGSPPSSADHLRCGSFSISRPTTTAQQSGDRCRADPRSSGRLSPGTRSWREDRFDVCADASRPPQRNPRGLPSQGRARESAAGLADGARGISCDRASPGEEHPSRDRSPLFLESPHCRPLAASRGGYVRGPLEEERVSMSTAIDTLSHTRAPTRRFHFVCSWCGRDLCQPTGSLTLRESTENYGICASCLQQCLTRLNGRGRRAEGARSRGVVAHLQTAAPLRRHGSIAAHTRRA